MQSDTRMGSDKEPGSTSWTRPRSPSRICLDGPQLWQPSSPQLILKRAFDTSIALLALVALMPCLIIIVILIKVDSRGPAFFIQTRTGLKGRPFRIVKFRTMISLEDGSDIKQATKSDTRVTRVGKWLRQCSLDELPQLINVIKGDMSLVGPRPHALAHDRFYERAIATYAFRWQVRPGITGWAQINGLRGETPVIKDMEDRVALDLWYIDNWDFWLDMQILLRTFGVIFRHPNVY